MKVEELKNGILAQHHMLRALLVDLGDVAQKVAEGDASGEQVLRDSAHQLADALLRHMEDEERILEALSREGHAPAAEHLAEFQHDHVHQRGLLASFNTRIDSVQASRRLGQIIKALTNAVLLDMEHEETAIFGKPSFTREADPVAQVA
ncbi:MAG TPA: hemerythrin domain-containing protein [Archangium sp.]|jgi:iron-sulfur cluster repair protein YtfE (RIC family)|uniref:hemerythrin domain-containing protein n=1 Tax=Archangium sp. TaxID=1872627 RepID=UPI002EDB3027